MPPKSLHNLTRNDHRRARHYALIGTCFCLFTIIGCRPKIPGRSPVTQAHPAAETPGYGDLFQQRLAEFSVTRVATHEARNLTDRFKRGEWGPQFPVHDGLQLTPQNSSDGGPTQLHLADPAAGKVHTPNTNDPNIMAPMGSTIRHSDEQIESWDTKVSFGVNANVFQIATVTATDNITFAITTVKKLFLVKERQDQNTQMISQELVDQTDSRGNPLLGTNGQALKKGKLVTGDGLRFVFNCSYTSKTENAIRHEGSVVFNAAGITAGATGGSDSRHATSVELTSAWYNVASQDTLLGLLDFCQDAFAVNVKDQAKREIANSMAGATYDESVAARARSTLISAALYGQKVSRVLIDGHHWNAPQATIDASVPGVVKVSGQLEHNIATQIDDVMDYSCTTSFNKLTQFDVDIQQNSAVTGWRDTGRGIIKDICHDAFIEFALDVE